MLWIFKFIPDALWYLTLAMGVIGSVVLQFIPSFAQVKLLRLVAGALVVVGAYFIGGLHNNQAWQAKVAQLQQQVAELETASTKANAVLETKVITKTQLIRERGQDIVKYIDREITRADANCTIPPEFISAHNRAAEAPK